MSVSRRFEPGNCQGGVKVQVMVRVNRRAGFTLVASVMFRDSAAFGVCWIDYQALRSPAGLY